MGGNLLTLKDEQKTGVRLFSRAGGILSWLPMAIRLAFK
jgi:hypothetical protein